MLTLPLFVLIVLGYLKWVGALLAVRYGVRYAVLSSKTAKKELLAFSQKEGATKDFESEAARHISSFKRKAKIWLGVALLISIAHASLKHCV